MHPFVKENREGIKGTEKIHHTEKRISQTQQNVWRSFFSTDTYLIIQVTYLPLIVPI